MTVFGPKTRGQRGYIDGLNRQMVLVGESAKVALTDGQNLLVGLNNPAVARAYPLRPGTFDRPDVEPQVFNVEGVQNFGEAFLEAKDQSGNVLAFVQIGVGPLDATLKFSPDDKNVSLDGGTLRINAGTTATVTLLDGAGLLISVTPAIAQLAEGAGTTTSRNIQVSAGQVNGRATLEAKAPAPGGQRGWTYASMAIEVVNGTTVAPGGPVSVSVDQNHTTLGPELGPVPAELLDAAEKGTLDISKKPAGFSDAQAKFVLKAFLHAVNVMRKHQLPLRGALLLAAHTFETGFGVAGPNVKYNNFLSFQPLPPLQKVLKEYGVDTIMEPRENVRGRVDPGTPCPIYRDVQQAIEMQITVAYARFYYKLEARVRDPSTTPEQYAAAADASNYGTKYSRTPRQPGDPYVLNYPDEYERVKRFILAFLQSLPSSMSLETRSWAERLRLNFLRKAPP